MSAKPCNDGELTSRHMIDRNPGGNASFPARDDGTNLDDQAHLCILCCGVVAP